MTVGELVEKLMEFDPDTEVTYHDAESFDKVQTTPAGVVPRERWGATSVSHVELAPWCQGLEGDTVFIR